VKLVIAAYERARADALKNPAQLEQALSKEAHLSEAVTRAVLKRTDLTSPSIGDRQKAVILAAGDVLKKSGVVKSEVDVPKIAGSLIDPSFTQGLGQS
jgi:sulfonate transport system substrate-binding protein